MRDIVIVYLSETQIGLFIGHTNGGNYFEIHKKTDSRIIINCNDRRYPRRMQFV